MLRVVNLVWIFPNVTISHLILSLPNDILAIILYLYNLIAFQKNVIYTVYYLSFLELSQKALRLWNVTAEISKGLVIYESNNIFPFKEDCVSLFSRFEEVCQVSEWWLDSLFKCETINLETLATHSQQQFHKKFAQHRKWRKGGLKKNLRQMFKKTHKISPDSFSWFGSIYHLLIDVNTQRKRRSEEQLKTDREQIILPPPLWVSIHGALSARTPVNRWACRLGPRATLGPCLLSSFYPSICLSLSPTLRYSPGAESLPEHSSSHDCAR